MPSQRFQRICHFPKASSRRFTRLMVILATSILFMSLAGVASTAHAASTGDPFVVVAVDLTNQGGPCTETFDLNIHTPQERIISISCPAGTVVGTSTVRRSQALALHEAYVALPASSVSLSGRNQAYQSIGQLIETKTQSLRQLQPNNIHPNVGCGYSGVASEYWSYNDSYFYSTESYYKTSDCSKVNLEVASINFYGGYSDTDLDWSHDQYQGGSFGVPNCPYVPFNTTISHSVDQLWSPGYYYENWLVDPGCTSSIQIHNNMGPLN